MDVNLKGYNTRQSKCPDLKPSSSLMHAMICLIGDSNKYNAACSRDRLRTDPSFIVLELEN